MEVQVSQSEFADLPYRDDVEGDPARGQLYRAKAWPDTVFNPTFERGKFMAYHAFKVVLLDKDGFRI